MSKDLFNKLNDLSQRINKMKDQTLTEEATKMSFIMPFFSALGYDIFNPSEFVPEFTADVGTKKGEKVDYAIIKDGEPVILIEAKHWQENLDNHINQLYRYFGVTTAKFGILTNGIEYRFYSDLQETNKMDTKPFMVIDLTELRENTVAQLNKFTKDTFNMEEILSSAEELMYISIISKYINNLYTSPTETFVRFLIKDAYKGQKNAGIIEKFTPIVKKAFNLFVNDIINDKLKTAFEDSAPAVEITATSEEMPEQTQKNEKVSKIITTDEELQAYYIVKSILAEIAPLSNIVYKDTESYFGILFTNNVRKWICRFKLSNNRKILIIPDSNNGEIKHNLSSLNDIYNYKNEIITSCERFLQ